MNVHGMFSIEIKKEWNENEFKYKKILFISARVRMAVPESDWAA